MFCQKCGSQMSDGEMFCPNCGAAQEASAQKTPTQEAPKAAPNQTADQLKTAAAATGASLKAAGAQVKAAAVGATSSMSSAQRNRYIGIAGIGVGALIILIILINLISANTGYRGVIKDYYKSIQNCDAQKYIDCAYDEAKINALFDNEYDDEEDLIDYCDDYLSERMNNLEDAYGDNVKISVKIKSAKKLSEKKVNAIEDEFESYYDESISIKKAYDVRIKVTFKGKDDKDIDNSNITVMKTETGWTVVQ